MHKYIYVGYLDKQSNPLIFGNVEGLGVDDYLTKKEEMHY